MTNFRITKTGEYRTRDGRKDIEIVEKVWR